MATHCETNLPIHTDSKLGAAARALLDAAMAYWEAYAAATGGAAVVWLTDTDGRMVLLTRGEYRDALMRNVDSLRREQGPVRSFGDGK